jgi:hypothetical protein
VRTDGLACLGFAFQGKGVEIVHAWLSVACGVLAKRCTTGTMDHRSQIGVDENDQNEAQNLKGTVEAVFTPERDNVDATPLAPYSEASLMGLSG